MSYIYVRTCKSQEDIYICNYTLVFIYMSMKPKALRVGQETTKVKSLATCGQYIDIYVLCINLVGILCANI